MENKELVKEMIYAIQQENLADEKGKLPSEKNLMHRYEVSRYAIRQALEKLSDLGYIYQAHGIGSFVRPKRHKRVISLQNNFELSDEMTRQSGTIKTVQASQRMVDVSEAEFLPENNELIAEMKLIEIKRLRTLDDRPYLIEQSYYLQAIAKEIPEPSLYHSVFTYFEKEKGIKVGFMDKIISSEPLSEAAAKFFQLTAGGPSLVVRDDTFLSSGELFAFSKNCYDYRMAELFMFKKSF